MTNKERLISFLGFSPGNGNAVDGELIDAGIDGTVDYDGTNVTQLKMAAVNIMELLLTTPDTGNSDPNFSIKYDRVAVEKRLAMLKQDLGLIDDSLPTIRGLSIW